jgi:hypothetical protein
MAASVRISATTFRTRIDALTARNWRFAPDSRAGNAL